MSPRHPNILVTGGAGFIGSHLCEALLARGYRVRVLDSLIYGNRDWVPAGVEFLQGDIRSLEDCQAAAKDMDGVIHCAAMSRSGPSQEHWDLCTQSNIAGTQNMLLAARGAGLKRFIYSASATRYGSLPPPHVETMAPEFLNIYALTKHSGEAYAMLFDRAFDLPTISLRYFSVYGPRQPWEGAYALVLGIFLERAKRGEVLEIHGDGSQRRDFVHVRDVVAAQIAAYESDLRHQAFNVGSATSISVQELADLISPNQRHAGVRADDSKGTLADISKIRAALGWSPQVSFKDGLEELMRIAGLTPPC